MERPLPISGASLHPVAPDQQARDRAREVAGQFEQVLVRSLVGALRQTADVGGEEAGMFGSGPGADTYGDWFDEHLAGQLQRTGKIGVADVLMREFERWQQIPAAERAPSLLEVDTDTLRRRHLTPAPLDLPTTGGIDVAA